MEVSVKPVHRKLRTGTCLQGYLPITFERLCEVLGKPHYKEKGYNKSYNEWVFKINGSIVTIYDYKEDGSKTKGYEWHIGGHTDYALASLNKLLDAEYVDERAIPA